MSVEQLIALSTFLLITSVSIIGFFIKRTLNHIEAKQLHQDICVDELKRTCMTKAAFEVYRGETKDTLGKIFVKQEQHTEILGRLDERSKGDDKLALILQAVQDSVATSNRRRK